MTSQGSVYGQFQRALERGNALMAVGLAKELPKLSLENALRLALLFRHDPEQYPRYATRWHAGLSPSWASRRPTSRISC